MTVVVAVHGIGAKGVRPERMHAGWLTALNRGLATAAGGPQLAPVDLALAFYRPLFAEPGLKGVDDEEITAADLDDDERVALEILWQEAAATDPSLDEATKAAVPRSAQALVARLSGWGPFEDCPPKRIPTAIRQVSLYLRGHTATGESVRDRARAVVADAIGPDTRVIVAHSLGTVVAYEALCAHPEWPVRSLITVGSPLGWQPQIFDKLSPTPVDGLATWPGSVATWTNVAFHGDPVALRKELAPLFPPPGDRAGITDHVLRGARMHAASCYLEQAETGAAVHDGLRSEPPAGGAGPGRTG